MAEPQELAKLQDIHLPDPIGWWPMAPGWYALIILAFVLAVFLFYLLRRSYLNGRAKREALQILKRYEEEHQRLGNSQLSSMKISELLRRVALVYFQRAVVAGLKGEGWLDFLTQSSKGIDFKAISDYLLILPYQPLREVDLEPLFHHARRWIKQRGKPCSN